jgi:hypothetical protein
MPARRPAASTSPAPAPLTREQELRLQDEHIARRGVTRCPGPGEMVAARPIMPKGRIIDPASAAAIVNGYRLGVQLTPDPKSATGAWIDVRSGQSFTRKSLLGQANNLRTAYWAWRVLTCAGQRPAAP